LATQKGQLATQKGQLATQKGQLATQKGQLATQMWVATHLLRNTGLNDFQTSSQAEIC